MHKPHVMSGGRYPVLRALAIMYLVGAALTALALVVGIIYIYARATGTILDRTIMSIGAIVSAFFVVVSMLALAEVLKLFIDVEHNTRMAAQGRAGAPATVAMTSPTGIAVAEISRNDGGRLGDLNIDEETAEAALIRGH